jgi:hypothetical protein
MREVTTATVKSPGLREKIARDNGLLRRKIALLERQEQARQQMTNKAERRAEGVRLDQEIAKAREQAYVLGKLAARYRE